ncbi:KIR protein [Plasmodium coatneyi]|uniref:KIR protein n=1 Tax=Plasmodium coatneyi TaxID=208452 RepID=A0A1B1DWI6_9APIC|nr:KIR protein [Plasmodium coatneyi]ANQ07156.1 KIR protein [Plasmodium coatneyi]
MNNFRDVHLRSLTSKRTYDEFDAGRSSYSIFCKWLDDTKTKLRNSLGDHQNVKDYVDKIVEAWCYGYAQGTSGFPHGPTCTLFYYWLADKLLNELKVGTSFLNIMKTIYDEFKSIPGGTTHGAGNDCGIIYEDGMDENLFKHAKILYEYQQDRHIIEEQHLKPPTKSCTPEYISHLQNITTACSAVTEYCNKPKNKDGSYCNQFNAAKDGESGGYCSADKLQILTCDLQSTQVRVEEPGAHDEAGIAGSTPTAGNHVTAAVSSILGIGAVPALGYFLYKDEGIIEDNKKGKGIGTIEIIYVTKQYNISSLHTEGRSNK